METFLLHLKKVTSLPRYLRLFGYSEISTFMGFFIGNALRSLPCLCRNICGSLRKIKKAHFNRIDRWILTINAPAKFGIGISDECNFLMMLDPERRSDIISYSSMTSPMPCKTEIRLAAKRETVIVAPPGSVLILQGYFHLKEKNILGSKHSENV